MSQGTIEGVGTGQTVVPTPFGRTGQPGVDEGSEFPENQSLDLYVKPPDFSVLATKSN